MRTFFKNDEFQFGLEIALGSVYRQTADAGEVMAVSERIADGDGDSWVNEWLGLAEQSSAAAAKAESAGHHATALAAYRRACTYWATALYMIDHSKRAGDQLSIWRDQRRSWEKVVGLSSPAGQPLQIPYEETTLAGYFFPAPGAAAGEKRPLLVMNNGSDGATSQMWVQGGAAAAERGWHWMTFDGPGQQSALFEQEIPFRHDWEAVLGPVLDTMFGRSEVDADRIAVLGVSQAGYWIPRAISFEHRFAAAVADPGVTDVSASWLAHLPDAMRQLRDQGEKEQFDAYMREGAKQSPGQMAMLEFRARPYGIGVDLAFDLYREVERYRLGDEIEGITTPLLVTDPENEQFWPGQSRELYERLGGPKEIVGFTAEEGADRHCEPVGSALREARIFDWLEERLR